MALAWHLQERKYGGLKPLVQRRLEALTNAYRLRQTACGAAAGLQLSRGKPLWSSSGAADGTP